MAEDNTQSTEDDLMKKIEDAATEDRAKNDKSAATEDAIDEVEELKGQLARAMADLQNFKRRTEEDQAKFIKFANAELLKKFLPVLDHLSLSVQHLPDDLTNNEWAKGVVQINEQALKALTEIGVEKIATVGQVLDPNLHEALISGPGKQDEILEELEPGYTLNGITIKAAKVKVGDGSK